MDFDLLAFLTWYIALVIAMVIHEAAHALAAWLGGDPTAYEAGQVTVNPIPHMRREPFGMILMPVISFLVFPFPMGFAHAPYNPYWADRHPRRAALMATAGPAANLLLALFCFALLRFGLHQGWFEIPPHTRVRGFWDLEHILVARDLEEAGLFHGLAKGLSVIFTINFILGLFNLIPVPPLDGAGIAQGLLPGPLGGLFRLIRSQQAFSFLGLILAWYLAGRYLIWLLLWAIELTRRI